MVELLNDGIRLPGETVSVLIVASLLGAGPGAGGGGGGGGGAGAGAGPALRNSTTYVRLALPSADTTVIWAVTLADVFITIGT